VVRTAKGSDGNLKAMVERGGDNSPSQT